MVEEQEVSTLLLRLLEDPRSGVSATRTRFASASGSPTCRPQLSQSSARASGAIRSTSSAIFATRTKIQALYNPRTVNRLRLAELVSAATRLPVIAVPLFLAVGVEAAGMRGLLWAVLCIFLTSGARSYTSCI